MGWTRGPRAISTGGVRRRRVDPKVSDELQEGARGCSESCIHPPGTGHTPVRTSIHGEGEGGNAPLAARPVLVGQPRARMRILTRDGPKEPTHDRSTSPSGGPDGRVPPNPCRIHSLFGWGCTVSGARETGPWQRELPVGGEWWVVVEDGGWWMADGMRNDHDGAAHAARPF